MFMVQAKSFISGKLVEGQSVRVNVSPVDGKEISQSNFLSSEEIVEAFTSTKGKIKQPVTDFSELEALAEYFREYHEEFTQQIIIDAAFTTEDAKDLVDGSIEFCEYYAKHLQEINTGDIITTFTFIEGASKRITLTSEPYGTIAATTPRNTPLITELTIIVHALWSGNTVVLRPSPGVAGTVALLIEGLRATFKEETLAGLAIIFADAKEFVSVSLDHANLIHYVGSSKYLETTLIAGIKRGVKVLLDGDGCSMAIIDKNCDIKAAAEACYKGLIRCNGQICISMRAIVIEESVYEAFSTYFLDLIKNTVVGVPKKDAEIAMGPLFSAAQVENIKELSKKYKTIYIDESPAVYGTNYISPVVVSLDEEDRVFLREALFGPMVGLATYKGEGWKKWLEENPINLTDTVFSDDEGFVKEFLNISKSPRRVINVDPTIESVFEPWGAFLPSGWNDVSYWFTKYKNYFQLVKEK